MRQETIDGKKVVVLSQQDGSTLYVANTGPAHAVRIDEKKPNGWQINLTEHGVDFHLAPPSNALSNAISAGESVWLDAVDKLVTTMDQIFAHSPTHLTSSVLTTLSQQLGECSRELKRIGSPSQRLQPVYTKVAKACAGYDRGAECFAAAARVGIPMAGSAADRKLAESIECGFASSAAGTDLGDAIAKGEVIKAQVG